MKTRVIWCVLFLGCWLALLFNEPTRHFAFWNLVVQLAIFIPSANIPGWLTNRLSYVDFAWPAGLAAIGMQVFFRAEALTPLTLTVASFYTIVGLRMGIWGSQLYRHLKAELPRYAYQRRRWQRAGFVNERLSVQYEILVQAMANASFLALPAILVSTNQARQLNGLEVAAIAIWILSYGLESLADIQKRRFTGGYFNGYAGDKPGVCDVGLWRYSRHPNYFFQWMQWVSLVTLALPSILALHTRSPLTTVILLLVALLWVVHMMYSTMVYYTGAVPAEYYSAQKRPAYAQYQATVNRFFPGPRAVKSYTDAGPE